MLPCTAEQAELVQRCRDKRMGERRAAGNAPPLRRGGVPFFCRLLESRHIGHSWNCVSVFTMFSGPCPIGGHRVS